MTTCLGSEALFAADEPVTLPAVTVIGSTPLPGVGLDRDQVAAPVQTGNSAQIERSNAIDLPGYLLRFLGSVYVNDIQNNPFQADLNYRGYTASPLLGTPQGLSVYLDGVRLNQPFGDVVSWDLIPRAAIASFELMPGSNPLFGLNTLGGALSIQTKDGIGNPGTSVQAYYGMNSRWSVEFEQGGSQENGLNWYFTGNYFSEDGWRDDSPSEVGQIFGKVGWKSASDQRIADGRLRRHRPDRKRLAGAALPRARLRQRLYQTRYDEEHEHVSSTCWVNTASATTCTSPAMPTTATSGRRRSTATSTTIRWARTCTSPTRPSRRRSLKPDTRDFRPAARTRAIHHSLTGGALPMHC